MKIVVTGISRLWAGILNPARGLRSKGLETIFYYFERKQEFTREDGFRIVRANRRLLLNLGRFFSVLRRERPRHLDFYFHTGRWNALVLQASLTRRLGIPIVSICTGDELLNFARHSPAQQRAMRKVFSLSHAVVIKELYMEDVLRVHDLVTASRIHFCSNKIEVGPDPVYERNEQDILFLNLFKEFRRIDLIIEAAPLVLKRFPSARFVLAGAGRYPEREAQYEARIRELGLTPKVLIAPYSNETKVFFERAAIFLLPADIVFCNNALLEAMERGVPPIVADVPGAERIVEHGVSGLRVPQETAALAEAIIELLSDENYRLRLARGARKTIVREFGEEVRAQFLWDLYEREIWPHSINVSQSQGSNAFGEKLRKGTENNT